MLSIVLLAAATILASIYVSSIVRKSYAKAKTAKAKVSGTGQLSKEPIQKMAQIPVKAVSKVSSMMSENENMMNSYIAGISNTQKNSKSR